MDTTPKYQVFGVRWWVLVQFALVAAAQSCVWVAYGPVAGAAHKLYGWGDAEIGVQAACGPLLVVALVLFVPPLAAASSLRALVVAGAACVSIGASLRALSAHAALSGAGGGSGVTLLALVGSLFNALTGPITCGLSSRVSATWFEPELRTTATAIASLANQGLGVVLGFALGFHVHTATELYTLLVWEAVAATLLLLVIITCFPARPPIPPTASADAHNNDDDVEHSDLNSNLLARAFGHVRELFSRGVFIGLAAVFAVVVGLSTAWCAVLPSMLAPLGYSNEQANAIGLSAVVLGALCGLALARLADAAGGALRSCVCAALFSAALLLGVFVAGSGQGLSGAWLVAPGLAAAAAIALAVGCVPLFLELGGECTYPLREEHSASMLSLLYCAVQASFLLMLGQLTASTSAARAVVVLLAATCIAGAIVVAMLPDERRRSACDRAVVVAKSMCSHVCEVHPPLDETQALLGAQSSSSNAITTTTTTAYGTSTG